ncbi:MAG: fatty acid desaturase [Rhodospirillaceae bacterium]
MASDTDRNEDTAAAPPSRLLATTVWDAVPALLGLVHFGCVAVLVGLFPTLSPPAFLALALLYAIAIAWNIHSVSHNLIHNPFFASGALNRVFSVMLSLTLSYPQVVIRYVHLRHHIGNMDRPNDQGETRDLLSIYRHGRSGGPESLWTYCPLIVLRTDPVRLRPAIAAWNSGEGRWATAELALIGLSLLAALAWDWRVVPALLPFWLLGHILSALTNYYEHLGADPSRPIAWGVSSYGRLYNWLWLNNGYHAEHHFRTKAHWRTMKALHQQIAEKQRAAGTKVLSWPHPLGFLG